MKIRFDKLNPNVTLPEYAHINDAGADVYMCEDVIIKKGKNVIPLGFSCTVPPGFAAFLSLRSSWMAEGLVSNFVPIDPDYTGMVHFLCYNCGDEFTIKKGEKICQLLVIPVTQCEFIDSGTYYSNMRGSNGLGSTGK